MNNESGFENDTYSSYGIGLSFHDDISSFEESFLVRMIVSTFLGVSMILSLIGNSCTCAVIAREGSMQTPINYYLLNLAITDLMTALFVPIEIYILWVPDYYPFGEEGCRMHFLFWDLLSNCSVLTILAFTIERYLVISKPFLRQRLVMNSRVFKIIAVNWMLSGLFSIPNAFYSYLVERKSYVYCFFTVTERQKIILIATEMFVFFIFPMSVIFVLYVLIAIKLKFKKSKSSYNPAYGIQNKNRAVKMLAAVAFSFFICWSPYSILRIILLIPKQNPDDYFNVERVFLYMSVVNSYLSTVINPILYSLMSRKFRHAFIGLLKSMQSRRQNRIIGEQNKYNEPANRGIQLSNFKLHYI